MSASTVRKQFVDLRPEDLAVFPVWEYALDEECIEGQDETTVRPIILEGCVDPSDGPFLVKAHFVLADGSKRIGLLTPPSKPENAELASIQPCIVTDSGIVLFWYGLCPIGADEFARSYARLGESDSAQVFPVQFESAVPLKGGSVKGQVDGFVGFKDWRIENLVFRK